MTTRRWERNSNEERAIYFAAAQLEAWATQIEDEITNFTVPVQTHAAKRVELYEVRRQIDALRRRFPTAF